MDLISEVRAVDTGTVITLLSDANNSPTEVREWADESGNEVTEVVDEGDCNRIHSSSSAEAHPFSGGSLTLERLGGGQRQLSQSSSATSGGSVRAARSRWIALYRA